MSDADTVLILGKRPTTMDIKEAKLIMNTCNEVFEILEKELELEHGSKQWNDLYDKIVWATILRKAKSDAEIALAVAFE